MLSIINHLILILVLVLTSVDSQIITGASNQWIVIWNITTGTMTQFWIAHGSQVSCLKLLSVNRLVSGGFDGKLYVWNLVPISPAKTANFSGHSSGTVNCVEKLNNGNVVSGGSDQYLRVWNPSNGSSVTSIQAHSSTILSLKTLNNGYIASGSASSDNTIKIWTQDLSLVNKLTGHTNDIMMLDQLFDGTLISASIDTYTILWDVSTGNPLNKFKPLSTTNGPVTCLKQLPSGYIVFAGNDSSLYTWNVTGNNTPSLFATTSSHMLQTPCQAIVLYSDSSLVYSSKGIDTDLMIVDGLSQLNYNKSFTLSAGTWATCLENQGFYQTTTIATTSTTTTTTITTTITSTTTTITTSSTTTSTSTYSTTPITTTTTTITTTTITTSYSNAIDYSFIFNSQFSLSNLTLIQYISLLNSSYDLSSCIVNCSNHGLCKYAGNNSFVCICEEYYGGITCQQNLLPCSQNPCLNNATCYQNTTIQNQTEYSYYCECDPLYYGSNCEYKIDVCLNETCSSNGICKDVKSLPVCQCFVNFIGDKCQIETAKQKTIKTVTSTASIIAIIVLVLFYLLIILSDLSNLLCKVKKRRRRKAHEEKRLVYIP